MTAFGRTLPVNHQLPMRNNTTTEPYPLRALTLS
jgi:hypothetical protein